LPLSVPTALAFLPPSPDIFDIFKKQGYLREAGSFMKIIAIRHGEIGLNATGKTTGWLDEELTPTGVQQAQALADSLTAEFSTIIASPLRRAAHTAELIAAKHPARIILDPNIRERNFGSLSGKSWAEIEAETGLDLRHRDVDLMDYDYRPYGGESAAEVIARTKRFILTASEYEAAGELGSGDLVAVTHGGIIKVLYSLLASDPRKPITNCSVHNFYVDTESFAISATGANLP
jgi:probable phosphoglycerate mutase